MMTTQPPRPKHDTPEPGGNMDHSTVSHLLGVATGPPVRPADALAMRIEGEDGQAWAIRALANPPIEGFDNKDLLKPPVNLDILRQLHRQGKRMFHDANANDDQHAGLLWYLTAIAIAMADHDEELSSQPRQEVINAVLVFADAMPNPWRARLEQIDG
ncbi:MAG: hypothetical protein MK116_01870 [Phycisphaerales bacterium]|nr:hypothetical protein [Phycisphaerales bacterium]